MNRRPAPPTKQAATRVVVIDDDDFEREFLVDLLRTAGLNATGLRSVFGVTNHLVHEAVEVVVLDVMMPSIRGDKLATLLRKNPALPKLGVVLISSLPEAELAPIMAAVEVDAFVSKAHVRSDLVDTINSIVARA